MGRRDVAQVAVSHRQRRVTQRVTDHVDRGPLPGQLGGVGVAEAVGVHPPVDPRLGGQARQQPPDVAAVDPSALKGAEDRRPGAGRQFLAAVDPPGQQRGGLFVEADGP